MTLLKVKLLANYIVPLILMMERILWGYLTLLTKPLFPHSSENNAPDLFLSLSSLSPSVSKSIFLCGAGGSGEIWEQVITTIRFYNKILTQREILMMEVSTTLKYHVRF